MAQSGGYGHSRRRFGNGGASQTRRVRDDGFRGRVETRRVQPCCARYYVDDARSIERDRFGQQGGRQVQEYVRIGYLFLDVRSSRGACVGVYRQEIFEKESRCGAGQQVGASGGL